MGRWFCFGKKDFCDDIENCFSCKFASWEGSVNEDEISLVLSKIFGEDYKELDRDLLSYKDYLVCDFWEREVWCKDFCSYFEPKED